MWKQVKEDFWKENRASKVDQVNDTVRDIIEMVRERGDAALIELAKKFDEDKARPFINGVLNSIKNDLESKNEDGAKA